VVDADQTFVIIGGGLAGARAAGALREEGFTGRVILIGDERDHPYERPPLSKGFLAGTATRESTLVHPPAWYAASDIELRLGQTAVHIDREARCVRLGDGTRVPYDRLLLATGAEPRRLDVPGTDLVGVHHLRRLAHAERLRGALAARGRENGHLVVAGAGWTGLEVAAAARAYGAEVTVVERDAAPLHRVLGPELGEFFADLHREHGVRFHFGATVTRITGQDGVVRSVLTDDGDEHPAHEVLAAVGAAPRTALAESAGLALAGGPGGGIAVDAALRTSDPHIHAAGDAAAVPHPLAGGDRLRVDHWANALHGGPAAARAMLGREARADRVPYFFSGQYDVCVEYSGWAPPGSYDQVLVRGDLGKREFVAFWTRESRVLAGLSVNVGDATAPVQALISSGRPVDTAALLDPDTELPAPAGT
jgi:3-phenylpropionate/trans-cinnamate dioxygenase ferredoxin reductase subunit